jgi:ribosomal protein S30
MDIKYYESKKEKEVNTGGEWIESIISSIVNDSSLDEENNLKIQELETLNKINSDENITPIIVKAEIMIKDESCHNNKENKLLHYIKNNNLSMDKLKKCLHQTKKINNKDKNKKSRKSLDFNKYKNRIEKKINDIKKIENKMKSLTKKIKQI